MKQVCPPLFSFLGHSPVSLRGRAGGWDFVAPVVPLCRGHTPARSSCPKKLRSIAHDGFCTAGPLCWMVVSSCLPTQAGRVRWGTEVLRAGSPRTHGCAKTSGIHVWPPIAKAYSTAGVLQKPVVANTGSDRQIPTLEGQHPPHPSSAAAGMRQSMDGMQQAADSGAFSREWSNTGPHGHPPSPGPPQAHGYPSDTPQYHMQSTTPLSPSYNAYGYSESMASPGFQYGGVSPEGYAPGYKPQWGGAPHPEGYVDNAAQQLTPSQYMAPNAFGGPPPPQPYPNTMPPPQQQHPYHPPHAYAGNPDMYRHGPPPVNNMPAPQMFPPPAPGVPFGNAVGAGAAHMPAAEDTGYRPDSLDPNSVGTNASDMRTGAGSHGQPSGNTGGEDRLEQLLVEIRQRLGVRASTYDAALEESPRALLELACRPESLRRMQHSSLDWWYILFRWQDRYHALQLSGEIRRQTAAAAAAAAATVSSGDAATAAATSNGPGVEGSSGPGQEKTAAYSNFLPADEKAFFTFLQKLHQAFAARPLSEEAQTHGRLHDRMRCIRQLARTVSDDHRGLGMGAVSRKEADNLLWSLTVQEARCAANDIDILRTKGGMPMLLSILRLAETADRRRRRGNTRVLVSATDTTNEAYKAPASAAEPHKRQDDVIVQGFPGGRELKWVLISAEETQNVFEKLAEAFLSCAQEANIEPCVHAVVGLGILAEKGFLQDATWMKVTHAMVERLRLSEMVSAGTEAGLLLDALTWMLVRNTTASRRCRNLAFQVNLVLGQILRDTRSDVVARCVLGLALGRVFREENLLFYTNVLLKRQLRSEERRKTLTPRAFCNLLVANAVAGISSRQHLVVPVKYLLNTMATHDRARNLTLEESARLAWAICAMRLYDPAVAESQWPAKEAAELLTRVMSRIKDAVDGPQAAFLLEVLRDSHDCIAPLYPEMGFKDRYADQDLRGRTCAAYDQHHLGHGGATLAVVRNGLKFLGGTVTMSPERQSVLAKWRNASGPSEDLGTPFDTAETATTPENSSAGDGELPAVKSADANEATDVKASATKNTAGEATREKGNTSEAEAGKVRGDSEAGGLTEGVQARVSSASPSGITEGSVSSDLLRGLEWIEGAVIDGYPVAFYAPNAKIALDVDLCSRLPSKYMKRRHLDNYLRDNGIRYVVFSADLKRPQELLFTCLERVLKDESGTSGEAALYPVNLRAYVRTARGPRPSTSEETQESA